MSETTKLTGDRAVGPLPLVIGITGHRDLRLEDIPALEARVRAIFTEFQERYPQTPLILLSPLAEGADRLVARVALEQGARLIVPMPLPQVEYQRDFTTAESRAEFESLLAKAERSLELPLLPGNTIENVQETARRADQYAFVGAYIVRHCQILIALWNGVHLKEGGGTGEIVTFQREGIPERYRAALSRDDASPRGFLDPPESGPAYHIVTPRREHAELVGEPLTLQKYFPGDDPDDLEDAELPESAETFDRIYANINAFNQNSLLVATTPLLNHLKEKNAGYLLNDTLAEGLPRSLQELREHYAVSDTLAQHFQSKTLQTLKILSVIVFFSVFTFELTAKLAPDNGWLALLFPLFLGIAWGLWYVTVNREKWQDRHQDYRALAEGLRVEFFWRLGGVGTSVSDNYLRKQRGELDWIRIAIRNMSENCAVASNVPVVPATQLGLVLEHWVQNQSRYFSRAAHRDDHELECYEKAIKGLIVSSPVIALATALVAVIPSPLGAWMHHQPVVHKLLIIAVFVLAGVAGVLHAYVDKRALSQHSKQYERMATLFTLADQRMSKRLANNQLEEARLLLLELGKESLAENGDWVMTHRERPVDVPHAG